MDRGCKQGCILKLNNTKQQQTFFLSPLMFDQVSSEQTFGKGGDGGDGGGDSYRAASERVTHPLQHENMKLLRDMLH